MVVRPHLCHHFCLILHSARAAALYECGCMADIRVAMSRDDPFWEGHDCFSAEYRRPSWYDTKMPATFTLSSREVQTIIKQC